LRRQSAALRHHVWAAGILASLTIPFLALLPPVWHTTTVRSASGLWTHTRTLAVNAALQGWPSMVVEAGGSALVSKLASFAVAVWVLGVLLIMLKLIGGLARLHRVSASSHPLPQEYWIRHLAQLSRSFGIARPVHVLQCDNPAAMPLTWGLCRPRILLPDQLLVLARTLQSANRGWFAALAVARPSNLERRFVAMLNPSLNRARVSVRAKLFTAVSVCCVLFAIAALRAPAQDSSGQFTGTIYDPSRAAVPNATVVVTNRKAGTIDMTTSDAEGKFQFKALPAADYEVKVLKPGFKAYVAPSVMLQPGRDLSLDISIELGSVAEEVNVMAENPARSADSRDTAKPGRIASGGNVMPPLPVTKVQPIYPPAAKAAGVQGSVILHAIIGIDGRPLSIVVKNSQIDPELARSAVEAVSQWRYRPTMLNGEPVEVDTTITVNFSLN